MFNFQKLNQLTSSEHAAMQPVVQHYLNPKLSYATLKFLKVLYANLKEIKKFFLLMAIFLQHKNIFRQSVKNVQITAHTHY